MTKEIEKEKKEELQNILRKVVIFLNVLNSSGLFFLAFYAISRSGKIYGSFLPGLIFAIPCAIFLFFNVFMLIFAFFIWKNSNFIPKRNFS